MLDDFKLDDVTIIGASLGGMLAPRAAAFVARIHRVIAWSVFQNLLDVLLNTQSKTKAKLCRLCLKLHLRSMLNLAMNKVAKTDELVRWGLRHGMYAYEAGSPYDYAVKMNKYQMMNIAEKITQDMLIVGANRDHFIDYISVGKEIAALKNVHSLSFWLFTDKEDAYNHYNCGNVKLTFNTFMNWIEKTKKRDKK